MFSWSVVLSSILLSGLLTLFLLLGGCDQNDDVPQMTAVPVMSADDIPLWLDGGVEMPPQQWLIKRSRAEVIDEQAEIDRAAELIMMAADRFGESPRMIANRAAQLEDMLLENRINETAVNLLEWFTNLPTTQSPHSFSALCQYYYNLRTQGKSEDEILQHILRI